MTQWNDPSGDGHQEHPTWTAPGGEAASRPQDAVPGRPAPYGLDAQRTSGIGGDLAPSPGSPVPPGRVPSPGAPRLWPGPIPLRPLSFGEIIETAFRLVRHNPRTLLGLSFVVLMTTTVIGVLLAAAVTSMTGGFDNANSSDSPGTLTLQLASLPLGFISFFLSGILIIPIAEAALGHRLTAGQSWGRVKGRLLSLLGYLALMAALYLVVLVPFGVALFAAISQESPVAIGAVLVVGILLLIAFFVWAGVKFSLAPAAIVLEQQGPISGIRRSFALTRNAFWRTWAIQFVVGLITWLISTVFSSVLMGIGMAVLFIPMATSGDAQDQPGGVAMFVFLAVMTLGSALSSTLVQPLASASTALIYLDRRFRTEALAVELMAAADRERGSRTR